jgi:adenosylcobyric acid synthase
MGRRIIYTHGVESTIVETTGLGLLDVETVFDPAKITARVTALHLASGLPVSGYEIHAGRIVREGANALLQIRQREGAPVDEPEGALSEDERVVGTSVHGLFDGAHFRRHLLNAVRAGKGLSPLAQEVGEDFKAVRERAYDRMADAVAEYLDLRRLLALAGLT